MCVCESEHVCACVCGQTESRFIVNTKTKQTQATGLVSLLIKQNHGWWVTWFNMRSEETLKLMSGGHCWSCSLTAGPNNARNDHLITSAVVYSCGPDVGGLWTESGPRTEVLRCSTGCRIQSKSFNVPALINWAPPRVRVTVTGTITGTNYK